MENTCESCKYLYKYKKAGDIFWHYRCQRYPDAEDFDTWKSLRKIRSTSKCGYIRKEYDDLVIEVNRDSTKEAFNTNSVKKW